MSEETIIRRKELMERLGISTDTIRRHMKAGLLPQPDTKLSRKTYAWRRSTLEAAGVKLW